jgi:hypothetical protein
MAAPAVAVVAVAAAAATATPWGWCLFKRSNGVRRLPCLFVIGRECPFLPASFAHWLAPGWCFLLSFLADRWLAGCHVREPWHLPSKCTILFSSVQQGSDLLFCTMGWFGCSARDIYGDVFIRVISWVIIYLLGHLDWRTGNWTAGPGGDTHTYQGPRSQTRGNYSVRPGLGGKVCHCVLS